MHTVTLNNDLRMPALGFGTWRIPVRDTREAVLWILQTGYRMIDASPVCGNKPELDRAVRESGLDHEHGLDSLDRGTNWSRS
jgi:2,5-diketo-D-gluconate reductase A